MHPWPGMASPNGYALMLTSQLGDLCNGTKWGFQQVTPWAVYDVVNHPKPDLFGYESKPVPHGSHSENCAIHRFLMATSNTSKKSPCKSCLMLLVANSSTCRAWFVKHYGMRHAECTSSFHLGWYARKKYPSTVSELMRTRIIITLAFDHHMEQARCETRSIRPRLQFLKTSKLRKIGSVHVWSLRCLHEKGGEYNQHMFHKWDLWFFVYRLCRCYRCCSSCC